MYLHKDRENFKEIIEAVADETGRSVAVIEKDYYVTQILRLLSEQLDGVVFKGGTSLSKGFHVINRFSEDIDITFSEHIGESRRKKLKNVVLKGISQELGMDIVKFDMAQSDRDYNAYHFAYDSVAGSEDDRMPQFIKLEIVLGSYSFPTVKLSIDNYIGRYLKEHSRTDLAENYMLASFDMNLQAIERTYIDKVFALCDYYMQGKTKRYSRHLYDIYKLTPMIKFDEEFKKLVKEVRTHRATLSICPSAALEMDIKSIVSRFCEEEFYKKDFETITGYFADDIVKYEITVRVLLEVMEKGLF